jgi:hypothetical protein
VKEAFERNRAVKKLCADGVDPLHAKRAQKAAAAAAKARLLSVK